MTRLLYKSWPVFVLVLFLTGCTSPTNKLTDERTGFWDVYVVGQLSDFLDWIAHLLWNQYGLALLVLTILVRSAILPLSLKQYSSSKRMQALQPELKKLKEKYKDDAKKQQEETMKLFQTNGVNPLAGCFPLLIQMPVFIGLYQAIMRNPDISGHTFLWLKLGVADPFYVLPVLAALTTFIQQKMMPTQVNGSMKALLYVFPVLIFFMSLNFASALPLYWVYSNTYTIVQSYFIYRPDRKNGKAAA